MTVHTTRKRVWRFVRNAQASAPGLRETAGPSWYAAKVQGVPLGLFIFLVQIAAGGAIVQAFLDWLEPDVSPGYLQLNGLFFILFGGAGAWLRAILPAARMLSVAPDGPWIDLEVPVWIAFTVLMGCLVLALYARQRPVATRIGAVGGVVGLIALTVTSLAYAPATVAPLYTVVSIVGGALALGTSWNGMMLGHWYLNTPRLAPRPLVRLNQAMAAVVVGQGAYAALLATVIAPAVMESWFFWVRVGVGLVFPLALSVPVHLTARVRSMMSATGLLYIALGAILAGELVGRLFLFFGQVPI